MPAIKYALERVGEKDLEVSWTGNWENITISYKGDLVGTIPTENELIEGRQFHLPDGRVLRIWRSNKYLESGIYLEVNGEPVPRSAGDPEVGIEIAAALNFLIGGIMVILGTIEWIFDVGALFSAGFSGYSIVSGTILLVLAVFILRKNRWALVFALAIFIIDTLVGTYWTVYKSLEPNMSVLVLRVLVFFQLYKARFFFNKIKVKENK